MSESIKWQRSSLFISDVYQKRKTGLFGDESAEHFGHFRPLSSSIVQTKHVLSKNYAQSEQILVEERRKREETSLFGYQKKIDRGL